MTGLEALRELKHWKETNNENGVVWLPLFAVEDIEKSLKALDIIKEKRIDIESFYTSFIEGDYDYGFYERRYGTYGKYCLTEEEFNLLKEGIKEC